MIAVFGATGTIGSQVLAHLAAQKIPVRVVARTENKAAALRTDGIDAVVADLADPASLPTALAGAEHVFVSTPASADQVTLESNLIDALSNTNIHLVKLAALGYDAVPVDQAIALAANHARIVDYARQRDVAMTVLAPSGFQSNLLASADTIRQGQLYGSAGDGGIAWIDPFDVGAVAAHVLTTEGHLGKSYAITGPEILTHDELAAQLTSSLGHEVNYVDLPAEQFEQSLKDAGVDDWTSGALAELHQLYRAHHSEVTTTQIRDLIGRDARSLQDWLNDTKATFTA